MADILLGVVLLGVYLLLCYFTILVTFVAVDEPKTSALTIMAVMLWAFLILIGGELGHTVTWCWPGTCVRERRNYE